METRRREHLKRVERAQNPGKVKDYMGKFIQDAKQQYGFTVKLRPDNSKEQEVTVTADDEDKEDKILAFQEMATWVQAHPQADVYPIIVATDLRGQKERIMTLSTNRNVRDMMNYLTGKVFDGDEQGSDARYQVDDIFDPAELTIQLLKRKKTGNGRQQIVSETRDAQGVHRTVQDDPLYDRHNGEFFLYLNKSGIDLRVLRIFSTIDPLNYPDNCFISACIQSGAFSDLEIDDLRRHIRTRKVPKDILCEIERNWNCFFKVTRVREGRPKKSRLDTRPMTKAMKANKKLIRVIPLLLYKEHWMYYGEDLPVTPFYILNKALIDEGYPEMPLEQRQLIAKLDKGGSPEYYEMDSGNRNIMPVLDAIFATKGFELMPSYTQQWLRDVEYKGSS
jgi:hypothetical protein